jgi:hypothetical protein
MGSPRMRLRRTLLSVVGCLVACAVALQAALAGFVVISSLTSAAIPSTEICSEHRSVDDRASGQVGHHSICPCGVACVMSMCIGIVGAPAAAIFIIGPVGSKDLAAPHADLQSLSSRPASKGPHCPRAPPRTDVLTV